MSKNKLIMLADKLDRNGHTKEAALVDEVILKRSFDEQVRGDIKSVLDMVLELTAELQQAVKTGVAGLPMERGSDIRQRGFRGSMSDDGPLADWYEDKLRRVAEGVEYAHGFVDLTEEADESPEDPASPEDLPPEEGPGQPVSPEIKGPPRSEEEGGAPKAADWSDTVRHIEDKTHWWKKTLDRMNQREAEKDSPEGDSEDEELSQE